MKNSPFRNLCEIPLQTLRYHLIAPKSFEDKIDRNNIKSIKNLPWIDMPDYAAGHEINRAFWKQYRVSPSTRIESERITEILYMVNAGIGVTIVPENMIRHADLVNLEILHYEDWWIEETLNFVFSSETENNPLLFEVLKLIKDFWPDSQGVHLDSEGHIRLNIEETKAKIAKEKAQKK